MDLHTLFFLTSCLLILQFICALSAYINYLGKIRIYWNKNVGESFVSFLSVYKIPKVKWFVSDFIKSCGCIN